MRIVTSGSKYLDIDGYAGCVAYAELLRASGVPAKAVSLAPLNESISPKTRIWDVQLDTSYNPSPGDTFALIDVSDPEQFDSFVILGQVDEVIDHHLGYEKYWQSKNNVKAQIEFVGAACTQVYERWQSAGLINQMSQSSARLLICGILDNTLNFGASITSNRDRQAYAGLLARADLPNDWPSQYFIDCETLVIKDLPKAIRNDTKILKFLTFDAALTIGQLVVWDGRAVLDLYQPKIEATLSKTGPNWFMNLISLSDNRSYFVTDIGAVKHWLSDLLELEFTGSVAAASRPWLRKEIVKRDIHDAK